MRRTPPCPAGATGSPMSAGGWTQISGDSKFHNRRGRTIREPMRIVGVMFYSAHGGRMMLKPPRDAQEAFERLAPDLEEIANFMHSCPLTTAELRRLATLLGNHFHELASSSELASVRRLRPLGRG